MTRTMIRTMIRTVTGAVLLAAVVAGSPAPAAAQPGPASDPDIRAQAIAARLSERFKALASQDRFSGEMLVWREGRTIARDWFGGVPARGPGDANIYPLASLTKTFTGVAVLLLAQQQKLALADPVSRFFPELDAGKLAASGRAVTIDDLLGHTSGLGNMRLPPAEVRADPEHAAARMLGNARLTSIPGREYAYSNEGYVVLGEVIRRVSGKSYAEFVQQAIVGPLALSDTMMLLDEPRARRKPPGLYGSLIGLREARSLLPHRQRHSRVWSGAAQGGMHATAADVQRFFGGVLGGKLLTGAWLDALVNRPPDHTRGLVPEDLGQAGRILWHNGQTPLSGHQSFAGFLPATGIGLVVLANVDDSAVDLTAVVMDAVQGLPLAPPPHWTLDRVYNTFLALRLGWLMALAGLAWLLRVQRRPRLDRAGEMAVVATVVILVALGLLEAPSWLFVTGCGLAALLVVAIARRPAVRPWRWSDPRALASLGTLSVALLVLGGVIALRQLS
jgi:D-alanyl-D-alanine carboxypeptidase